MEENPIEIDIKDSILNSTKKQLGILPDMTDFDTDILICINSAISTLRQLGVGPQDSVYTVEDASQTYNDYLGEGSNEMPMVKGYLYQKTKLMFDPPQSSIVFEAIKSMIKETECRLLYQVDPEDTFE